ncbi:MAG: MFS transporter [Acidipropionibacterium acidipropionici]|uniref:Major facilitator family protein transporter n=1 Tax=Acidipropionibacterium acidipropionici (strain ATCC 4875 / DSM 20272 / JCM 6432 / NBRC 12425 / NCIMB 8070 / 4) TaxID=1171373 RepID=K7RS54_ACIA4|nr:MFS transporter [Acidipropionibacterium acidipropionici]AFV89216.1 Major facilitator family protein transporter [Acidipropionibacterium acidipropionici ATCC 4875]ALN16226.1 MFS transporter [Acidipropionibacterium acidipropionici]APZ08024.1 MFS transporter [Acidipropionibacterium acidipropionici]
MTTLAPGQVSQRRPTPPGEMRRIALAGAFGTGIELYDFLIFGLASGLVFPHVFFPQADPLMGTLQSFMAFGAGFISRPLGGIIFGHFGDRVSRKTMLVITLLATGTCTVAMGLLPTYATVGAWAPVLLVSLRVLQGVFMGGEQSGAFIMVTEHAPAGHKAVLGAAVTAGSPIGSLLGIGAFQVVALATGDAFAQWGWRIPFLASAVLIGIGLWVRIGMSESPEFQKMQAESRTRKVPLAGVFAHALPFLIAGILVNLGFNQFIFIVNSFTTSYAAKTIGFAQSDVLLSGLAGSGGMLIAVFVAGRLADRFGLVRVMSAGALFQVIWAFPYFWLVNTGSVGALYLAVIGGYVGLSFVFGPMAAYYVNLFNPEHRYSGVAFSYNLGAVLGGGLSPSIATALLRHFGDSSGVSVYVAVGGLLTLVGLLITARHVRARERSQLLEAGLRRGAARA